MFSGVVAGAGAHSNHLEMSLLILAYMSVICPGPIYLFENYLKTEAVCPSETPVTQPQVC